MWRNLVKVQTVHLLDTRCSTSKRPAAVKFAYLFGYIGTNFIYEFEILRLVYQRLNFIILRNVLKECSWADFGLFCLAVCDMVEIFIFVYMPSKLMLQTIRLYILLILISFQHFYTKITNLQAWVCVIAFHSVLESWIRIIIMIQNL